MKVTSLELRFADRRGARGAIRHLPPDEFSATSAERGRIEIAASAGAADSGRVVRATIRNKSAEPIFLDALLIEVATGLAPERPARFFKHGYQSWSSSGAYPVISAAVHRRDGASRVARLNHQSEARRPREFPEALTSEMFAIVERTDAPAAVLAGFAGAAHELTTVTVPGPERVIARVLLDGIPLEPGSVREVEPLLLAEGAAPAVLASRWAGVIGKRMNARTGAPYQRGWCSWYHYFDAISEDALRANLHSLAAMRDEFPLEVVQLDDGFQAGLGDWEATNAKFPSGLRRLADEIRAAGFTPGLWTAPFLAARDSRLMREHPGWFIRHESGEPLRAGYNPNWTADRDAYAYALDASNPAFREHLERLFGRLVREFGYSYLKLDFLYAAAAEGTRFDPAITRAETLRRGLEAIRAGAGDETFLLGCGCPLGQAIGIVDAMRIGPDVSPFWGAGGAEDPSTVHALDAIVARSFMHRRLWLNDPDCLMLRASETRLSREERFALAAAIAVSGGMLLISDDMNLLDTDCEKLFRMVAAIGMDVDNAAAEEPPIASNLMHKTGVLVARGGQSVFHLLLNTGETPQTFSIAGLLPAAGGAQLIGPDGATAAAEKIELPPHSARIIRG